MTYYDYLKEDKKIREKAEADKLRVKMIYAEIDKLHNVYNGQFLDDLEQFLKNYKS